MNLNYTCPIILCLRIFSLSRILMATFSPVSQFRANLTLAKLPSPRVRPSSYLPTRVLLWLPDLEAISDWTPSPLNPLPPYTLLRSRPLLLTRLPDLRLDHTHLPFQSANETNEQSQTTFSQNKSQSEAFSTTQQRKTKLKTARERF